MPVSVKVTPFTKSIQIVLDKRLSKEARQQRAAAFARQQIDAADAINKRALGTVPPKTITVDGREGAALTSVNPDKGLISVHWRLVSDVLVWIMQTLRDRSPVVSGRYRDSHALYAGDKLSFGTEVLANEPTPLANQYTFLNTQPYTRKIEFGVTKSGRAFTVQVEPKIYERTAAEAKAKYGNVALIKFSYVSLADLGGTAIGQWSRTSGAHAWAHAHGRRTKHQEWLTRVPAIVVTLR